MCVLQGTTQAAELDRLTSEMQHHEDCTYGTVTAGDNIYGSEVVQNVLNAYHKEDKEEKDSVVGGKEGVFEGAKGANNGAEIVEEGDATVPKIVFAPYDSRATAEFGM